MLVASKNCNSYPITSLHDSISYHFLAFITVHTKKPIHVKKIIHYVLVSMNDDPINVLNHQ